MANAILNFHFDYLNPSLICQADQNGFLQVVHHGKVDVSHVQAKFHSAMAVIAERTEVLSFELKAKKRTQNRNT